jgi:hypothetical protein
MRIVLVGVGLSMTFLAGCGEDNTDPVSSSNGGSESRLAAASTTCDSLLAKSVKEMNLDADTFDDVFQVGDGGKTLVIDTEGNASAGLPLVCIFEELKTPLAIRSDVENTTALQGQKTADQDGLKYSWSYHPDNGMDMIITEAD